MSDTPYSILFEPVKIGPHTARNRFYQVPHCSGMGHQRPQADAAMRAMKAEGGWAVVSNQETEIHPSSDLSPAPEHRLWDAHDIPALRLMTDAVRDKGALSAVELVHNGFHASNLMTRATVLAPSDTSLDVLTPKQARAMDKSDIRALRQWHRAAARRSREAGFDIVYVYAGHRMTLPQHFLLPACNDRTDEYGGSLENRVRLLRELLEDTLEEVGDSCAVALRLAVDEMIGPDGMQASAEGREIVEMLAELPDIWDVNVSDWANDSATSRHEPNEGYQLDYTSFVKELTSKPVVGVGRFTSPDKMVSLIRSGAMDFIGAARPSIADPFLPNKIREGRVEDIRECIGCNLCVSADNSIVPIRCTQNPTMGEEWRRGWHPERIAAKGTQEDALVIGAGPAGLECTLQLARRGYQVTLAEANSELGGRVRAEGGLPGLNAWRRVADNRIYELQQRANVSIFKESELSAAHVAELGIRNVFVATGATWRNDGVGRSHRKPIARDSAVQVLTPDDIMAGAQPPAGPVLIFDDDQIYMGGVLAEHLHKAGYQVTLATPATMVSPWTEKTLEQKRIQTDLIHLGVTLCLAHRLDAIAADGCTLSCIYSGKQQQIATQSVVMVTERRRNTALFDALSAQRAADPEAFQSLHLIGDAEAPGLIADAVFAGHAAARHFEMPREAVDQEYYRRELIDLHKIM